MGAFLFYVYIPTTINATIQHNAFSFKPLIAKSTIFKNLTEASFEPMTFSQFFHYFVLI